MSEKDLDQVTSPSADDLVARAMKLKPLVAANAARGEADRRVPDQCVRAISDAGLFTLGTPRRYGGSASSVRVLLDVSAAIAEADGGTGWAVMVTNSANWVLGLFPREAQDEVFEAESGDRCAIVMAPTARSRKVDGGWLVTGRWFYASGVHFCGWALVGFPISDEAGQTVDQGLALVPAADYTIEDTWQAAGLKSSGSNCIVAEDVFVPEHRVLSIPRAIAGAHPTVNEREPFYRSAFVPLLALALVGPQLGLGRAALEFVREQAGRKPISSSFFDKQSGSTGFQLQVAKAALKIETAHLHAYRAAADIDQAAALGVYPDYLARARVRADTGYAAENITEAIGILLSAHGAASFADTNPLQRIWRDANIAARHATVAPQISYEVFGKALLDIEDRVTYLV